MKLEPGARNEGHMASRPDEETIVLASASTARAEMLSRAGISFDIVLAELDEDSIKKSFQRDGMGFDSSRVALVLAGRKSSQVSKSIPDRMVIGADQILDRDGEYYNKPTDRLQARSQLIGLSGRTHELVSAVSVTRNGRELWNYVDRARLTVRNLSKEFIDSYLDRIGDAAYTSPGSYQVESLGAQLFDRIDGDHYTILGMPLLPLLGYLRSQQLVLS